MLYKTRVLKDQPVGFWPFDTVSTILSDASGNGNNASSSNILGVAPPLTAKGVGGILLSAPDVVTLPINTVMNSATPGKAFSFEFFYKPTSGTNVWICKRDDSGIHLTDSSISFTVSMLSDLVISYDKVSPGNVYYVVAVYDTISIKLYVNGQYIGSTAVTPEDYANSFTDTTNTLSISVIGGDIYSDSYIDIYGSVSNITVVDALAVYNYPLSLTQISDHYSYGKLHTDVVRVSGFNNSNQYRLHDGNSTVFDTLSASTSLDWAIGTFSGAATVLGNSLVNYYSDGTSQYEQGVWLRSISFEPQAVTLSGSRLSWTSNQPGLLVEVSVNGGTSYSTASNGSSPVGAANLAAGLDVVVRVTLPAGATQTEVDKLTLVFYSDKSIPGTNSDVAITVNDSVNAVLAEFDHEPSEFNDNCGVYLPGPSTGLTIPADSTFGGYQGIEFIIRNDISTPSVTIMTGSAGSPPIITTNSSGQWVTSGITSLYIDGQLVSSPATVAPDRWHHVLVIFPATSGSLYLANNAAHNQAFPCRIGYVATYFTQPTAPDIQKMYYAWAGTPTPVSIVDSSVVNISDNVLVGGVPVRAYSYNWGTTSGG
jgi:hypothetical protein